MFDIDITVLGKDAALYILFGGAAGFLGALIRVRRRFTDEDKTNDHYTPGDFIDIFIWICLGIIFALAFDKSIIISIMVGFFGPLLFNLLEGEAPKVFARLISAFVNAFMGANNNNEAK